MNFKNRYFKLLLVLLCAGLSASAQDEDFSFACGGGPEGCNVVVESHLVNIPRDANGLPETPFVYTIPNNPTVGQFKVIAQYRTRGGAGAEARGVTFNGIAGTVRQITYGTNTTYAPSYVVELTTGDVATLTLNIDSDAVDADNLPALEVIVFKCSSNAAGSYTGVYPDEFNWVGAPGNTQLSRCITRTLALPSAGCTADRQLKMKTGIFNIHQDNATCQRQIYIEYKTNDGQTFSFVETPPENNSVIEHNITVSAASTEIEISVCTWDDVANAPAAAVATGNVNCQGASHGWGFTVASDACSCTVPCSSPNCGTVSVIKN